MSYVMDTDSEYERLERQSTYPAYDYVQELSTIKPEPYSIILDAGCGSGVVSRYLAQEYPNSHVIGCDANEQRIQTATKHSSSIKNLEFKTEELTKLSYSSNFFDLIVCRYVIEHLSPSDQDQVVQEFYRCLKPGGKLLLIDMDGGFSNIFPTHELIEKTIKLVNESKMIDLTAGRKLFPLLNENGFHSTEYKINTYTFSGDSLISESELIQERLMNAKVFLIHLLGSERAFEDLALKYREILKSESAVLFYNKFIATGKKPSQTNQPLQLVGNNRSK